VTGTGVEIDLLALIGSYGFPIVMCMWFMIRTEKVIRNNTTALNNFNGRIR